MEALLFIKQYKSNTYDNLGAKEFSTLPRSDEFISVLLDGNLTYFQVIAILHSTQKSTIEIYAIQAEPTWEIRKTGDIGFSFR